MCDTQNRIGSICTFSLSRVTGDLTSQGRAGSRSPREQHSLRTHLASQYVVVACVCFTLKANIARTMEGEPKHVGYVHMYVFNGQASSRKQQAVTSVSIYLNVARNSPPPNTGLRLCARVYIHMEMRYLDNKQPETCCCLRWPL